VGSNNASEQALKSPKLHQKVSGSSTLHPGRDVASAAAEVAGIADALDIDQFVVMGHSGGGLHAVACGALLPERVVGVVCVAGLAPFGVEGWFTGMAACGAAELRTAVAGRAALETYLASVEFDEELFTAADHAALSGRGPRWPPTPGARLWAARAVWWMTIWLSSRRGVVIPDRWSHRCLSCTVAQDRVVPNTHGEWLVRYCRSADLWLCPDEGHISVLSRWCGGPGLAW
jgi:pimeloyl-ACP methyl ester carboxylesterase